MNILCQFCIVFIGSGMMFLVALYSYYFGKTKGYKEGMDEATRITFPHLQQLKDELDKYKKERGEQ